MAVAKYILLVVGLVLITAGLVGAASSQFIVGGGGCGTSCPLIGNLVGYVTNQSSGLGIVGATVKLLVSGSVQYTGTTTTNGYYSFGAIVAGGYVVNVTATGYKGLNGNTVVSPGTTATFSAQLAPLTSPGGGNGGGCTPLPTGACTVPPPPPGVPPPPPLPPGGNTTGNYTQPNRTITQTIFQPSVLSVFMILFGALLVTVAAFVKN